MIISGELLPGQQIRQESMAERLGVSRLPIREALRQLTADGLVRHTPNVGYMVTKLSQSEFDQIYLMRKALESTVLGSLKTPTAEQIGALEELREKIEACANVLDLTGMQHWNREFHFAMFRLSELNLVINEIEKLWDWASPYHAVYLFSPESRQSVLDEHAGMLAALEAGDIETLIHLMDEHRHGSETQMGIALGFAGRLTTIGE